MTAVSIAVLKQKLSSYLHRVEAGEEIVVTAHRRPGAHVVPVAPESIHVRPPSLDMAILRRLKGARLSPGPTAVDMLLEDRARR